MSTAVVKATVDQAADVAYIYLTDKPVVRTDEYEPEIQVDLDEWNMVVGIEFLTLDVSPDLASLAERYHIPEDKRELLEVAVSGLRSYAPQVINTRAMLSMSRIVSKALGDVTSTSFGIGRKRLSNR